MDDFKELFFPAICGSVVGYIIYSFIKGFTNDFFYRAGLVTGQLIRDLLEKSYFN